MKELKDVFPNAINCNECKHGMWGSGRIALRNYSQNPCNACEGELFEQVKEKKLLNHEY